MIFKQRENLRDVLSMINCETNRNKIIGLKFFNKYFAQGFVIFLLIQLTKSYENSINGSPLVS